MSDTKRGNEARNIIDEVLRFDPVMFRAAWDRVLGLAEWAEMIRIHMDHQAKLRKLGSANARNQGQTPQGENHE